MKLPKTPTEFVTELYLCSDSMEKNGDQRFRQLHSLLPKVSSTIISEGIVMILEKPRPGIDYLDQEFCGKILETINPTTVLELKSILKRTLEHWNKSVEQFPFWLAEKFGRSVLIETLEQLKNEGITPQEKDKAKTISWWLGMYNGA